MLRLLVRALMSKGDTIFFTTQFQQRIFKALKQVLSALPIEVLQLISEYAKTMCRNCNQNETSVEEWHTFEDGDTLCTACINELCLCKICDEITLTSSSGLRMCRCCSRPTCGDCVVQFKEKRYCISCFGWRSPEESDEEN